jgi:hypothetical protein
MARIKGLDPKHSHHLGKTIQKSDDQAYGWDRIHEGFMNYTCHDEKVER